MCHCNWAREAIPQLQCPHAQVVTTDRRVISDAQQGRCRSLECRREDSEMLTGVQPVAVFDDFATQLVSDRTTQLLTDADEFVAEASVREELRAQL